MPREWIERVVVFLSTPSARRATVVVDERDLREVISIHALREEGDTGSSPSMRCGFYFYPRPPRGGRRTFWAANERLKAISIHALREEGDASELWQGRRSSYFYPRPPRGGRHKRFCFVHQLRGISIHALREEGDWQVDGTTGRLENFYPRPPRGGRPAACWQQSGWTDFYPRPPRGGRQRTFFTRLTTRVFLSTPSARRATTRRPRQTRHPLNFYPRPPRGGRHGCQGLAAAHLKKISIHALREEGDLRRTASCRRRWHFYPRPPRGGRPPQLDQSHLTSSISIHALREEGDRRM